jgi:hypothetical protein
MEQYLYALMLVFVGLGVRKSISKSDWVVIVMCALTLVFACVACTTTSKKIVEPYVDYANTIVNQYYVEPIVKEPTSKDHDVITRGLEYYVSSYNPELIDFTNDIIYTSFGSNLDPGSKRTAAIAKQRLLNHKYNQHFGFKVDGEVIGLPCDNVFTAGYNNFTVAFFTKLGVRSYIEGASNRYSIFRMNARNLSQFVFLEVFFHFKKSSLNPDIEIVLAGKRNAKLVYTYNYEDYLKNKLFANDEYHSFVLTKEDFMVKLYMDCHLIIDCSEESCFESTKLSLEDNDTEIIPSSTHFKLNHNNSGRFHFWMTAFAIYPSRVFQKVEIDELHKYLLNTYLETSPDMQRLHSELDSAKNTLEQYSKSCPYPQSVCESTKCGSVRDWKDLTQLTRNPACFRQIVGFCDANKEDNPVGCAFTNKDAVFQMASAIDDNFFYYDKNNEDGNVKDLSSVTGKKSDVRDVYLDKSLSMSGSMNKALKNTLDELMKKNHMDVETVNASPSSSTVVSKIDYDNLLDKTSTGIPTFREIYDHLMQRETFVDQEMISKEDEDEYEDFDEEGIDEEDDDTRSSRYEYLIKRYRALTANRN